MWSCTRACMIFCVDDVCVCVDAGSIASVQACTWRLLPLALAPSILLAHSLASAQIKMFEHIPIVATSLLKPGTISKVECRLFADPAQVGIALPVVARAPQLPAAGAASWCGHRCPGKQTMTPALPIQPPCRWAWPSPLPHHPHKAWSHWPHHLCRCQQQQLAGRGQARRSCRRCLRPQGRQQQQQLRLRQRRQRAWARARAGPRSSTSPCMTTSKDRFILLHPFIWYWLATERNWRACKWGVKVLVLWS